LDKWLLIFTIKVRQDLWRYRVMTSLFAQKADTTTMVILAAAVNER